MKCFKIEFKKQEKNEKKNEFKKLIKERYNYFGKIDSKILTKVEELQFIENAYKNNDQLLMNRNFKEKLLYSATKDGDSSSVFHKKCQRHFDIIKDK